MKLTVGNIKRFDKVLIKLPVIMCAWLETLPQETRRMVIEALLDSVEVVPEEEVS